MVSFQETFRHFLDVPLSGMKKRNLHLKHCFVMKKCTDFNTTCTVRLLTQPYLYNTLKSIIWLMLGLRDLLLVFFFFLSDFWFQAIISGKWFQINNIKSKSLLF